jgi:hypothetical protein
VNVEHAVWAHKKACTKQQIYNAQSENKNTIQTSVVRNVTMGALSRGRGPTPAARSSHSVAEQLSPGIRKSGSVFVSRQPPEEEEAIPAVVVKLSAFTHHLLELTDSVAFAPGHEPTEDDATDSDNIPLRRRTGTWTGMRKLSDKIDTASKRYKRQDNMQ